MAANSNLSLTPHLGEFVLVLHRYSNIEERRRIRLKAEVQQNTRFEPPLCGGAVLPPLSA